MESGNCTEIFCSLCFNTMNSTQFEVIGEVIREILEVVLPNLNLEETCEHMCKECCVQLLAAFNFKSICMDTEDIIFPFINSKEMVNLKELYLKVKGNIQLIDTSKGLKICRLCLQLVHNQFMSLNEVDIDIFNNYLPQVNINVSKDPVICECCFDSLQTHGCFLKNCLDAQEIYRSTTKQSYIKTEEIEIKVENENCLSGLPLYSLKGNSIKGKRKYDSKDVRTTDGVMNKHNISNRQPKQERSPELQTHKKCNANEHNSKKKVLKNELIYKSEAKMYKCDFCDYSAKYKSIIKTHSLKHLDSSEVKMFSCKFCDFKTKYKGSLGLHKLRHSNISDVKIYNYDFCDIKAICKSHVQSHRVKYIDSSKLKMYKCHFCDFQTKYKNSFDTHQLQHADPSEVQMYQCDSCEYKSKMKSKVKLHQLTHADSSEVRMYKCDVCSFKSKHRTSYKRHELKHKSTSNVRLYKCEASSELQIHKCDLCDFESKHKNSLKRHKEIHEIPSELYKCYTCELEFTQKTYLINHLRNHKKPFNKCKICDFKTKNKYNFSRHKLLHESKN